MYKCSNYFNRGLACRYAGINPYDTCIISSTSNLNFSNFPYCQAIDFNGSKIGHEDSFAVGCFVCNI